MSIQEHERATPYWKRAHRDWRVWVGVILMTVAIVMYSVNGDLGVRPGPGQSQSNGAGK